jgi:hypothetical protein
LPAAVGPARIALGEILHKAGKGNVANPQGKMDVVGYATVGREPIVEAHRPLVEQKVELTAICFIQKDRIAGTAAEEEVIESTGKLEAGFAGYGEIPA